jgi:hypothetical protein
VPIGQHVFQTSYEAVDRDLPKLIARHKPDALLMFGLAPRAKTLRIETRARNALAFLPDVSGQSLRRHTIVKGGLSAMALPARARHLFAAGRTARIPLVVSRERTLSMQLSLLARGRGSRARRSANCKFRPRAARRTICAAPGSTATPDF